MTILVLDFMNAAHRARSGFKAGDHPVVFNFFRGLRSLVEQFKPTRLYVVLEGKAVAKRQLMSEYKANRAVDPNDPRTVELQKFFKQVDVVKSLLSSHFPVSVVRHPKFEADDTIANVIRRSSTSADWVLVSSDTDFIQLLHDQPNLKLYNPVTKKFVEAPDYDYVVWKALRGDATDNIPGVPGIGDKTADKIASDPELLSECLGRPDVEPIFTRNYDLIRFAEWSDEERAAMTSSSPTPSWDSVKSVFSGYGFNSMVKDGAWQKFTATFDILWGRS